MEDFCRTCGTSVNEKSRVNIFTLMERRLLHSVRTITNCWVEHIAGYPIYICEDCRTLVKRVTSFRKNCKKIEAFLAKRKGKQSLSNNILPATDKSKIIDPLRIEGQDADAADVEVQSVNAQHKQSEDYSHHKMQEPSEGMSGCFYRDQPDFDDFTDILFDGDIDEQPSDASPRATFQSKPELYSKSVALIESQTKAKMVPHKYTMRVGKRTMYIKLTNEKQPKRIVDRERQWASARPCICEHCGRQFKDGSNLNVHLLRHTGTKNYECQECNEKCYTLHLLRRHQLKHTEGPYKCTFCGLQYSTNSSRVRHEREACKKGRAPQSKTELIKRGERTFHCDVCDLWFLRAGNLTQHINSLNHIVNERKKKKAKILNLNKINT